MLAFTKSKRKEQSRLRARSESAERRIGYAVDRRPTVRKFQFRDVFRNADHEAEPIRPEAQGGFRNFFAQWRQPRPLPIVEQRLDPSFGSASGARLTLTTLGIRL